MHASNAIYPDAKPKGTRTSTLAGQVSTPENDTITGSVSGVDALSISSVVEFSRLYFVSRQVSPQESERSTAVTRPPSGSRLSVNSQDGRARTFSRSVTPKQRSGSNVESSSNTMNGVALHLSPLASSLYLFTRKSRNAVAASGKSAEISHKYTHSGDASATGRNGLSPAIHPGGRALTSPAQPARRGLQGEGAAALLLEGLRLSRATATALPSVDTHSLNGVLPVSTTTTAAATITVSKGSISSDTDGVASIGASRADLVAESGGGAEGEGGSCGWLCLRPTCLQHVRTARWALFWLCCIAAAQGMVVNGFVNVCITTIEKRFDLRSTDAGLIAGAYDLAFLLCSMPVSYLGSRAGSCKPRWLGWGVFIMGTGSFLFALPHFLIPAYIPSSSSNTSVFYCLRQGTRDAQCGVLVENWLASYRHIFVLGQFLHGMGASPLYTLGITYLDESVPTKMSSVYLGIFHAMAVVGPAVGFVLGGQFLRVYINAPEILPERYGLQVNSDLWLGGWWIGFLVSGSLCMLLSWPMMAFPTQLPGAKALKASRVSEAHGTIEVTGGFGRLRDLPQAVRVLTLNPTFVALSLAGATEGILLAGFATFTPKFLENQFSMAASFAALLVGFVVVPAGGGGTLLGGWIIKRLNLSCSGILKMCIIFSAVCLVSFFSFIISCPNINFAGVNIDYYSKSMVTTEPNLISNCNEECGCQEAAYDPICGTNNIMYFSPCHAGCTSMEERQDGVKVFRGCGCVALNFTSPVTTSLGDPSLAPDSALREKCPTTCVFMPIFLAIFFLTMLLTFIISLPALSGTLRCVPETHRSFALGLQWIVVRLLGTIPGPLLFGALFDNTCVLWQSTCGRKGACKSYDNFYMSRYMMSVSTFFKFLSTLLFFVAWWVYKAPSSPPALPDPSSSCPTTTTGPHCPPITPAKGTKSTRELQGIDNFAADLS